MNRGMKQAFARRFKDTMTGIGVFTGIMLVIMIAFILGIIAIIGNNTNVDGSFMFFGFGATVTLFVIGICTVREDLRLFIQHGIGRRTTFRVEMLVIVLSSVLLAVVGDLMVTLGQALASGNGSLIVSDFYQLLYLDETMGQIMALPDHFMNILFLALMFCGAQVFGMFISLGYYHLNKVWTIIVSIGVPLLLIFGLSTVSISGTAVGMGIDMVVISSAWFGIACLAVFAAVFAVLDWLLIRRVSIRPASA